MDPLLDAFARHLGRPPEQARPILGGLLADVRRALTEEGRAQLDEIGTFERTAEGLRFRPDDDLVAAVNQQYLGLPPITSRRPPMPGGAPPRSAPPAPPAGAPPPQAPPPETPPVFSVPLEPVEPAFAEPPPPTAEPGVPGQPLRDLSSEDEPAPDEAGGAPPEAEGPDPDLEALIARMREATEPLDLPFFTEQRVPDPQAPEPEPESPHAGADYDFFDTPAEAEETREAQPPRPAPEPAFTPPARPVRPKDEPRPPTPPPSAHAVPEAPERRRMTPWSLVLPLVFLALVAAAVWLWPRLQDHPTPDATPIAEAPTPAPALAPPDSAERALADSLARADSLQATTADSASVEEPAPEPEPEPEPEPAPEPVAQAPDPLRGGTLDPDRGGYGWVFGSGGRTGAEADAARWRRLGFRAAAVAGTSNGRPVYRVYVGQFATREEARAARTRLPADAPADAWVREIGP